MSRKTRIIGFLFFFLFLGLPLPSSMGAVPVITEVTVTDVTPVSFSVVFVVSEPSAVQLDVFESDCATPATGVGVSSTSNAATGVSRATVTGLTSVTTYCYQLTATSNSSSESASAPPSPATVTTETEVTRSYLSGSDLLPFSNDVLVFPSYLPDLTTPTDGGVLIMSVPGGSYPVSSFVGDGLASPFAMADMNNLFSSSNRITMNLSGGEVMTIREVRGTTGGTLFHFRLVPEDLNLAEIKAPEACFFADNDCSGKVDIFDAQRCFNQFLNQVGDSDYNDDLDVEDDNKVDIFDCQRIFNRFNQTAPFSP